LPQKHKPTSPLWSPSHILSLLSLAAIFFSFPPRVASEGLFLLLVANSETLLCFHSTRIPFSPVSLIRFLAHPQYRRAGTPSELETQTQSTTISSPRNTKIPAIKTRRFLGSDTGVIEEAIPTTHSGESHLPFLEACLIPSGRPKNRDTEKTPRKRGTTRSLSTNNHPSECLGCD
jgi:hypothetical protein